MKYFYVIVNQEKPYALETANHVRHYLETHGAGCAMKQERETAAAGKYTDVADVPSGAECVITIGGDGTLI